MNLKMTFKALSSRPMVCFYRYTSISITINSDYISKISMKGRFISLSIGRHIGFGNLNKILKYFSVITKMYFNFKFKLLYLNFKFKNKSKLGLLQLQ